MAQNNGDRWENPNFVPHAQRFNGDIARTGLIASVTSDTYSFGFGKAQGRWTDLGLQFVRRSLRFGATRRRMQRHSTQTAPALG